MLRLGLSVLILLALTGCFGSDICNDDCLYDQQDPIWSEDDQKLALTIPDFGDESSSRDNTYFIYTVNLDGSAFQSVFELPALAHVKSYNNSKEMALLEVGPERYSNSLEGYSWLNISTGELVDLLEQGPTEENCYAVDASASLDFSFIAMIYTPFSSCSEENTKVVFFNTENQTFDGVIEPQNNYKNRFYPSIYYTWSSQGLLVQDYVSNSRNQFYQLNPFTQSVSQYTQLNPECGSLDTNSTKYSSTGLTANVVGFIRQNQATVTFDQSDVLLEICQ